MDDMFSIRIYEFTNKEQRYGRAYEGKLYPFVIFASPVSQPFNVRPTMGAELSVSVDPSGYRRENAHSSTSFLPAALWIAPSTDTRALRCLRVDNKDRQKETNLLHHLQNPRGVIKLVRFRRVSRVRTKKRLVGGIHD